MRWTRAVRGQLSNLLRAGLLLTVAFSGADGAGGPSLKGAKALLNAASTPLVTEKMAVNEDQQLQKDIEEFRTNNSQRSPRARAEQWLRLVDRTYRLQTRSAHGFRVQLDDSVLKAMPDPAAWPFILKSVESRRPKTRRDQIHNAGLRLLASALTGSSPHLDRALADLKKLSASGAADERYVWLSVSDEVNRYFIATSNDPKLLMRSLEQKLAVIEAESMPLTIHVPELLPLLGEAETSRFLMKVLLSRNAVLNIGSGAQKTLELAQRLALENVAKLSQPQWALTLSENGGPLYEAIDRRFPPAKPVDATSPAAAMSLLDEFSGSGVSGYRGPARAYRLRQLLWEGRFSEAKDLAGQIGKSDGYFGGSDKRDELSLSTRVQEIDEFYSGLLKDNPNYPFWDEAGRWAGKAGTVDRFLKLRRSSDKEITSPRIRTDADRAVISLLTQSGRLDDAAAILQKKITTSKDSSNVEEDPDMAATTLIQWGVLFDRQRWIDAGFSYLKRETKGPNNFRLPSLDAAKILIEAGRFAEAEELLGIGWKKVYAMGTFRAPRELHSPNVLKSLVHLYSKVGRAADVMTLLDEASGWQATDVSELRRDPDLLVDIARAFAVLDKKPEALRLVTYALHERPGDDRAYEILADVQGVDAIPMLDQLFSLDRFEERPLIWKAEILRRNGKLNEAETVVRQAIAIDPTDGEQGPGDRLRAYTVLADILTAKGQAADAEKLRSALKAVRASEQADRYAEAGLTGKAIESYRDSLAIFADAYCIEARLAVQLAEQGRFDEAAQHYQRAYELMPDSFGQVESHCFGCEGMFAGKRAHNIADAVFTRLVVETPKKPQVHYLLGRLRQEQGRMSEAATSYRKAVTLDRDYLKAWEHLQATAVTVKMSPSERDEIVSNIIRLDPSRRHTYVNAELAGNLAALWISVAASSRPSPTLGPVYPLKASAAEIKTRLKDVDLPVHMMGIDFETVYAKRDQPADYILSHPLVRAAQQVIFGL